MNLGHVQSLCFKDMQCPTTHPFKLKNDTKCYDCTDGQTNNSLLNNCTNYSIRSQYNYLQY